MPLGLTLAVADYIRETGDFSLLDEVIPLADGGESTIYEKMIAGIDRKLEERGEHGLPLMGRGDWNDAAVICPWTIYLCYGDKRILEEQYESMKLWIEYIRRQGDNKFLWNTGNQIGD